MNKNLKQKTNGLNKLLYISFIVCASFLLGGCLSLKKIPLNSKNLTFKIQWKELKTNSSFLSIVSVKDDESLSLEILQPLIGPVARVIVNKDSMLLMSFLQKKYYRGEFNSQVFFPEFPALPKAWLFSILRAKGQAGWDCKSLGELLTDCKTPLFKIQWQYKKGQLVEIYLKDHLGRAIVAQIKSIKLGQFKKTTFKPVLKNWSQETDPLFFKQ